MDTVLGVYSCIAQDRDQTEKKKCWSQTRCPREITIGNYCLQVCTLRTVAGIAERVIDDHSNVICPSSCWERRSVRELLSPTDSEPLDPMPLKIEAWIFQFIPIQAVTAGQSPRVDSEFSLQQPAASAAQPRKRSFGSVLRVARNVDCS